MGKDLQKLSKDVSNVINNALTNFGESGSEVSNFIP